ncbi:MAG: hypothetical protein HXX16_16285, partial [Bacteroidales bacterium]|nr:hypothetical protein [Bacteroidales bacterium]
MKNYFFPLIISLVFLFNVQANCQSFNWEWAKYINEDEEDAGKDVTVDKDGNIIVVGSFAQTSLKFDNIQINKKLRYIFGLFCVKYNSSGNVIWAKSLNAVRTDIEVTCVSSDKEGNIFIGGHFTYKDTIYAGSSKLYSKEIGYQHIFVVKMDSSGNILWGLNSSGSDLQMINDIHCDLQGNFYICGMFSGDYIEFDGIKTYRKSDYGDSFFAKFDSSGKNIWVKNAAKGCFYGITTDMNNNILVSGQTFYPITFGNITLGTLSDDGTFLYKFDSNGNALWGKEGYGLEHYHVSHKCVYSDKESNIYLISSMKGYYSIDGFIASATDDDFAYIVKFNKDGVTQWITALDTDYSNGNDDNICSGGEISMDSIGNLYVAPQSSNPIIYGIDKNDGSVKWIAKATGSSFANKVVSIAASSKEEVYATGWYEAASLNFSDKFTIPNSYATSDFGGNNMFLAKLSRKTLTVSKNTLDINAQANSSATFDISSNVAWTASCNQTWLTLSSASGSNNSTIMVTATANTSSNPRTATVTVSGVGVENKTVTITQAAAPSLAVSPNTLGIDAAANSTSTFTITSNINWTASSNQSWLMLSSSSGSNNSTITVT